MLEMNSEFRIMSLIPAFRLSAPGHPLPHGVQFESGGHQRQVQGAHRIRSLPDDDRATLPRLAEAGDYRYAKVTVDYPSPTVFTRYFQIVKIDII
jgi:hypothetical protein